MAISDLYKVIKKEETYEYVAKLINKEVEYIASSNLYTMVEQLHLGKSRVDILDYIENLLEKDTPKKPLEVFEFEFDVHLFGNCPICGEGCNSGMKYCGRCGQALDWSKEDEC